jgi:hypothetical protein
LGTQLKNLHLAIWLIVGSLCSEPCVIACENTPSIWKTDQEKETFFKEKGITYTDDLIAPKNLGPLDLLSYPQVSEQVLPILLGYGQDYMKEMRHRILSSDRTSGDCDAQQASINLMCSLQAPITVPLKRDHPAALENPQAWQKLNELFITDLVFEGWRVNKYLTGLSIRYVDQIKGYGTFAEKKFNPADVIGFYNGEVYFMEDDGSEIIYFSTSKSGDDRMAIVKELEMPKTLDKRFATFLATCHPYFVASRSDDGAQRRPLIIDGTKLRNEISFVNHSGRFPNTEFRRVVRIKTVGTRSPDIKVTSATFAIAMIATKEINIGDQLLVAYKRSWQAQELMNMESLDLKPNKQCYWCNSKIFKRCTRCKVAGYCSTECQKKDWSEHKGYCTKKGTDVNH